MRMSIEEQIIAIILKCVNGIRFEGVDRHIAFSNFYLDSKTLYEKDKKQFDECTLSLLMMNENLWQTKIDAVAIECAGIFHKNGIDVYLFRMRYYLNIAKEKDDRLLEEKSRLAFSYRGKNVFDCYDVYSPYEKLFSEAVKSVEDYNSRIGFAIRTFTLEKWSVEYDCLIPYVRVAQILGVKIPKYLKQLYLILTEIPMILSDGLQTWVENDSNYKNKIIALIDAFQKIGLEKAQTFFCALKTSIFNCEMTGWKEECIIFENQIETFLNEQEILLSAKLYFEKKKTD